MIKYLRLVRFPNLLIIMLTQVLVRYCLILPAFKTEFNITGNFPVHLSDFNFILLLVSTVLIAASGYIINDYFDVNIDEINKPGKNIIGTSLNAVTAKKLYFIMSGVGVILGFYVAFKTTMPVMGLVPLFCAASLWMYSSHYKRRLFIGNVIVALLSALSVFIVGLYEPEFYRNFIFLVWYGFLAFLISLIRELIKDMQDAEGDELQQCKTAPIILGIRKTKAVVFALIMLMAGYIIYIINGNFKSNSVISVWYMSGMFVIPLTALSYLIITAREKKDFFYASMFTKILMLGGLISIFLFWHFFLK